MSLLTIRCQDQALGEGPLPDYVLTLDSASLSLRDLIGERVRQQVAVRGAERAAAGPRSLMPLSVEERLLNIETPKPPLSAAHQTAVALEAFRRGHLLVLLNGVQLEDLEERVELGADSEVVFLRLMPLVGG